MDDPHRGVIGAASLSIHSLLDGLAIGLAFQVKPADRDWWSRRPCWPMISPTASTR